MNSLRKQRRKAYKQLAEFLVLEQTKGYEIFSTQSSFNRDEDYIIFTVRKPDSKEEYVYTQKSIKQFYDEITNENNRGKGMSWFKQQGSNLS